ncbi:MAG: hypothetical protein RR860_05800 [Janthinobacterium sp.]
MKPKSERITLQNARFFEKDLRAKALIWPMLPLSQGYLARQYALAGRPGTSNQSRY